MLSALLLSLTPTVDPQEDRVLAWSEDLLVLVEQLEARHPDPYHGVSREEFEEAVSRLFEVIPDLTDDQVVVELMRLFGLLSRAGKEGHCGVFPGALFGSIPLQLRAFADGWFVVDAAEPHRRWIGARVSHLGGHPIEEVVELVDPLLTTDSETFRLVRLARHLTLPRLLAALGVSAERDALRVGLVQGGEAHEVTLAAGAHAFPGTPRPPGTDPLWLSDPRAFWWFRVLEDRGALYAQFNRTQASSDNGESLVSFAAALVEQVAERGLDRLVIDVRLNGGGDNTTFGPLIEALKGSERVNRTGGLYVLIGRGTFSAAGNFVTVVERETHAILVGEPTGGGPNQYGDAQNVVLPNHPELRVRVSTRYHVFDPEHPDRLTHEPQLAVPVDAAAWFAGRDPVLEAALDHGR